MNRRELLLAAAAVPISGALVQIAWAQTVEASQQVISLARLLTARDDLPEVIVARAQTFQTEIDPSFAVRLDTLANAVAALGSKDRETVIAALSESDARTAVQLISPLYLGYTGEPSTVKAIDGARFVTFLDALMYEATKTSLTRPSYAGGGPNFWSAVPNGVTAPPMDANIAEWGAKSPKAASAYAKPDPRYHVMCQGKAKTLAEAEAWLAANGGVVPAGEQK